MSTSCDRAWEYRAKTFVQVIALACGKSAVEAGEQVLGESGPEDVPTTRPDHPAVKYARSFTQNVDLRRTSRGQLLFQRG